MKIATQKCVAYLESPSDSVLSADIRAAALTCAIKANPSSEMFDKYVAAHNAATDGAVKQHFYAALGAAPGKANQQRCLEWALSEEVRSQDLIYLPLHVSASGKAGTETCFEW